MKAMIFTKDGTDILAAETLQFRESMSGKLSAGLLTELISIKSAM